MGEDVDATTITEKTYDLQGFAMLLSLDNRRQMQRHAKGDARWQLSTGRARRWFLRHLAWQPVDEVVIEVGEMGEDFIRNRSHLRLAVKCIEPGILPLGTRVSGWVVSVPSPATWDLSVEGEGA